MTKAYTKLKEFIRPQDVEYIVNIGYLVFSIKEC